MELCIARTDWPSMAIRKAQHGMVLGLIRVWDRTGEAEDCTVLYSTIFPVLRMNLEFSAPVLDRIRWSQLKEVFFVFIFYFNHDCSIQNKRLKSCD